MKKKFKLFATVASISLTLALMVFGVIAATSVNVTISSNVSYTADGVAFKLYGKSEVLASQPSGDATDLTDDTADKVVTVGVTNAGTDNMTLPSQTFTASSTWVVYTFTVENIGSNLIEAITVSATASDENVLASADVPTGNLTQGAKETFRCYFHLKNANRSISQNGTSVTIEIGESIATEASYIAPGSLVGFSSVTEGATTTWTKGQESFAVTSSTSGTTVTETNTFTNGDKTTTFTTTYNTSTVQTAASQTFSNTLSNYVIADRTLRTINITSGDNTTVTIPDWLNITATYGYSSSTATFYNLRNSLQEVNLPNTLKTINNYTFHSCSLDSIEIPAGVTSIGGSSFASCANLALVSFAPGSQLNSIGSYAFRNCASLTSIAMLNDGLGTIDTSAFEGCSSLTSFDMPSQLTSLGNRAFKDCSALSSIVLPAALSSVGTEVFSGCQLSSVTFASSSQLTTISNDIFTGAEIESLEIPASVTSIGNSALANITGLTEVDIKSQAVANSLTSVGEAEGLLLCMAGLNLKFTGVTPPEFVTSNLTYNGSVYTVPNGTAVNVTNINIQPGEGLDALEESSSNSGSRFSFSTSAQCVAIYEIEWNWGSGSAYEEIEIAEGFETISGEEGSYSFSYFPKTFTDGSIRNPMSARGEIVVKVRFASLGYISETHEQTSYWECLTGDMLVTMADGKKKRLKDLKKGDKVLGVDPLTGKLIVTTVLDTLNTDSVRTHKGYDLWKFSDGTELKTVHRHEFFSMTRSKMVYTDEWKIGEEFIKEDGKVITLVSHEKIDEVVEHFNLPTEHHTYFANGVLGGDRHTLDMVAKSLKF